LGKTDPNGKLKGVARWEKRVEVYGDHRKSVKGTDQMERNSSWIGERKDSWERSTLERSQLK